MCVCERERAQQSITGNSNNKMNVRKNVTFHMFLILHVIGISFGGDVGTELAIQDNTSVK